MGLLAGKNGLIFGIANDHSIGYAIAEAAVAHGARIGVNYQNERLERRVRPLADQLGAALCAPCDATDDGQLDVFFAQAAAVFEGRLDFVVHSLAFARKDDLSGDFADTSRDGFALAMDVSAYSLVALCQRAAPLFTHGGSVVALSYIGAERVIGNYNVMGPAKAALEASVKYLAYGLGPKGVRVNTLSAGPIKTLAARGIPGFSDMLAATAQATPLRRNVDRTEVANSAVFLLSDLSSGVTGETLHVDGGFHIMGKALPLPTAAGPDPQGDADA